MVSHVDDDHISSRFDEGAALPDAAFDVTSLWHNSFDNLLTTTPGTGARLGSVLLHWAADGRRGLIQDRACGCRSKLAGRRSTSSDDEFQTVQVLASISQGRQLRRCKGRLETESQPRES
jgi:hypothetical protein